jgi:DNA-binding transcriptional LysR family regulator
MLDLPTLTHFLAVARHQNLALAADALSLTPSAVSKSLKRLEAELRTQLFDREGRALKLNPEGRRLVERAIPLVAAAEQVRADFAGERHSIKCRIVGPDLLQLGWGQRLTDTLVVRYPQASFVMAHSGDEATLAAVLSGECDVGLVSMSQGRSLDARLAAVALGSTEFRVAAGPAHPLGQTANPPAVAIADLLQHDFVAPLTPPFASLHNQSATDGWRDDVFARKIRYRTDNLLLVQQLLSQGRALAYLPDYAIAAWQLHTVPVTGCPYRCVQDVAMVYRPSLGQGWVAFLVDALR